MAWKPDYVTSADLKAELRIGDNVDDAQIARAITAASRAIDRNTKRQFGLVDAPEARKYTAKWDCNRGRYVVRIDDLMTQVGLTITTAAGAVDVFALKPANAALEGRPWTLIVVDPTSAVKPTTLEDAVTVTAKFGWTAVPATVKEATLLQASRLFKRRDAPFGVAGSPELGSELRLLAKVDPDVHVMLSDYRLDWGAV